MTNSVIIYNQPKQKLINHLFEEGGSTEVDLSDIELDSKQNFAQLVNPETFALVFDGSKWISQSYMEWEDLRINEALQAVKHDYSDKTQRILTDFVASMDVKYQGKKSWVELLNELGKEIEA